jgi:hypothetical protein
MPARTSKRLSWRRYSCWLIGRGMFLRLPHLLWSLTDRARPKSPPKAGQPVVRPRRVQRVAQGAQLTCRGCAGVVRGLCYTVHTHTIQHASSLRQGRIAILRAFRLRRRQRVDTRRLTSSSCPVLSGSLRSGTRRCCEISRCDDFNEVTRSHDPLRLDLLAVEELDGSWEAAVLGKRADDAVVSGGFGTCSLDLVDKDLGRGPSDPGGVGIDAVHQESPSAGNIVDRVVDDLLDACALGNDVEPVCGSVGVKEARTHTGSPP